MREHNLDFGNPMTREQWEMLGRRAQALGAERGGFVWAEDRPEEIRVLLRDEDARGTDWAAFVATDGRYGGSTREVARFEFNDGRPYAAVQRLAAPDEPVITHEQEQAMRGALDGWVRGKWEQLVKESGLHYVKGRIPFDEEGGRRAPR